MVSVGIFTSYVGGAIRADRELSVEIMRRLERTWACFQRYMMEIYDRPGMRLRTAEGADAESRGDRDTARISLTTAGYGRSTTLCSSDA